MAKTQKQSKEPGFEEALEQLELIVARLEDGSEPLEKSLKLFEDGVGLARKCQQLLDDAQKRITMLIGEGESVMEVDPDTGELFESDDE